MGDRRARATSSGVALPNILGSSIGTPRAMSDSPSNWANQTIWTGDNIEIMRGMNSASVDLIYLDPPFNSKANYAAPIGSKAAGAAFKDTWSLSDVDAEWINLIEAKHPALHRVLLAAMNDSDKSYLAYMAARLLEMRRILKPTGSIYLHCDPTMSHYLKLVMDAVFGRKAYRNEISWRRTTTKNDYRQGATNWPRVRDVMLHYSQSGEVFHQQFAPYSEEYIRKAYRHVESGTGRRYRLSDLAAPGAGTRGHPAYELMGVVRHWRYNEERMKELVEAGRVIQTAPGRVPAYKRYLDEVPGVAVSDSWEDIPPVQGQAKERVGYPTQKPLALLRRIIEASSNPGDVVFDPFCGCATALVAAEELKRQWIGIDISEKAAELVLMRLQDELSLLTHKVTHRTDVPRRTDIGDLPPYRSHKTALYGEQGGYCAGCNTHFEPRNLEVDHIIARQKGGTDHIDNLQLLCGSCNRIKGDRGMEYLRAKLQL